MSQCLMCSSGYALFCKVCVAFFYTCNPTSAACEFSMNISNKSEETLVVCCSEYEDNASLALQ